MIEEEQSLSSKEISKALKKKVHDRYVLKIVPSMKVSKTKKTTYRKYL